MTGYKMMGHENFFARRHYCAEAYVRFDALACRRGGRLVFADLGGDVKAAQALALYGPNGSGKTSLLRQLAGLLPVAGGRIERCHITALHYLGHADGQKNILTVDESLSFEAAMLGVAGDQRAVLSAIGLAGCGGQRIGDLSVGQRRRLCLARLIFAPRSLWLLDEPLAALDQAGCDLVDNLAADHLAAGGLIIAASHTALGFATAQLVLEPRR